MRLDAYFVIFPEFVRLVDEGYTWAYLTVTVTGSGDDLRYANMNFSSEVAALNKKLVRKYKARYVNSYGWQKKRGAIHLHELIFFPSDCKFSSQEILTELENEFSRFGISDFEIKTSSETTSDDVGRLSGYLAKNYAEITPDITQLDDELFVNSLWRDSVEVRQNLGFKGHRMCKSRSWRRSLTNENAKRIAYSREIRRQEAYENFLTNKDSFLVYVLRIRNIRSSQIVILNALLRSSLPLTVVSSGFLPDGSYFNSQDFGLSARSPPRKGRWNTGELKINLKSALQAANF